jgi:hypothetical protein
MVGDNITCLLSVSHSFLEMIYNLGLEQLIIILHILGRYKPVRTPYISLHTMHAWPWWPLIGYLCMLLVLVKTIALMCSVTH